VDSFPLISAVVAERFDLSARLDEVGSSIASAAPTGKAFFLEKFTVHSCVTAFTGSESRL
jgi:hypothetical protein